MGPGEKMMNKRGFHRGGTREFEMQPKCRIEEFKRHIVFLHRIEHDADIPLNDGKMTVDEKN
jgi:hypothetical protein